MEIVMWTVAADRQIHSPSRLTWSDGWRPPGAESALTKWTGWTFVMALAMMTAP